MPFLLLLPPETLSQILSYLYPSDLERLGRVFNKRLTPVCIPLLRERITARRNARRMIAHFGEPQPLAHRIFDKAYAAAELEATWGQFKVPDVPGVCAFTLFDYLGFDRSLHWLDAGTPSTSKEHDEATANDDASKIGQGHTYDDEEEEEEEDSYCQSAQEEIEGLVDQATALGTPLPTSLLRYLTDSALQRRIPDAREALSYGMVGPIVRIVGQDIGCVGFDGYALRVHSDHAAVSFYWDKDGGECVLSSEPAFDSPGDADDEDSEDNNLRFIAVRTMTEEELGIACTNVTDWDIQLEATSFEEFIAKFFFEGLASEYVFANSKHSSSSSKVLSPMLEEFLIKVFSEKGRACDPR